jgi:hypothetical protein
MILCICHNIRSDSVDKSPVGTQCGKCLAGETKVVRRPSKPCSEVSSTSIRSSFNDNYLLFEQFSTKNLEHSYRETESEVLKSMIRAVRLRARDQWLDLGGTIPSRYGFPPF